MSIKVIFAFLVGAALLLFVSVSIWLYLEVEGIRTGINSAPLVPDRVAAILFALAFGSALAAAGAVYVLGKELGCGLVVILVGVVPFLATFGVLWAAHSQLPSMQFTNRGDPVSPWGYLIICGLPIVIGYFAGAFVFELTKPKPDPEDG